MAGLDFLASIGGNAMNGLVNEYFQKRAADYNFEIADKAAANEYNRQLDFWRQQNAYNDPRRQVARMVSAGLSPVDNVDSGNAQGLSSVPGNDFAKGGAIEAPQLDLIDAVKTFSEIRKIGKDGDLVDQQVANLISDQYLKGLEGQLRELGLSKLADEIEGIKLKNSGESLRNLYQTLMNERATKENKYIYTEEYMNAMRGTAIATLNKLVADGTISQKDLEYYQKMGIHPDRVGSPRDRIIISALDSILGLFGHNLKSILNPQENFLLGMFQ